MYCSRGHCWPSAGPVLALRVGEDGAGANRPMASVLSVPRAVCICHAPIKPTSYVHLFACLSNWFPGSEDVTHPLAVHDRRAGGDRSSV